MQSQSHNQEQSQSQSQNQDQGRNQESLKLIEDSQPILAALKNCELNELQIQRIFHGRGHTFAGLDFITLDWYAPALFICVFRPVDQDSLEQLIEQLWAARPAGVTAIAVQQRRGADTVCGVVKGELVQPHVVTENGIRFYVQLNNSQNVGVFPDMINGRAWVKAQSGQKNVLNLFSYTCIFSVAALQGGASQVINVDMNKSVMSMGRKNHLLNDVEMSRVKFFCHNIFNSWGKIKRHGRYDLIIVDPPSFQKGSFVLTKDYQRLIKRLPELAGQNADVMLCLNSPEVNSEFILTLVREHCPQLTFIRRLENHSNFPEVDAQKSLNQLLIKFATDF